jgi:hypothetical protein
LPEQLDAAHAGHPDVGEDGVETGGGGIEGGQGLDRAAHRRHGVSRPLELLRTQRGKGRLVIDDQDAAAGAGDHAIARL